MNKVSDIVISQQSFVSLHVQLYNQLRHLIVSGLWPHATRIPSELQLAESLNLSRTTVRLALQQAEIEGLIERAAGRGTFVAYTSERDYEARLIAFVTYGFDSETHLHMLTGAESELKEHGYQVILNHVRDYEEEIEVLKRLKEDRSAACCCGQTPRRPSHTNRRRRIIQQVRLPLVAMDRQIYGIDCDCVTSENYEGGLLLMKFLIQMGHQRIAFLTHHEMNVLPVRERYRAYCDALLEAGLSPIAPWLIGVPGQEIHASDALRSSVDSSSPELKQIISQVSGAEAPPTAIFALNDYVAVLAMRAMLQLGIRIPQDMSLVGFDDISIAAHLEVPLTTVAQDSFMIGKRAAKRLIERLEGYSGAAICDFVPTQLRIRSSAVAPARIRS
ncbi:MAG: GntR family transcriptional regulator [Anaerolineae bacterium]